MPNKSSLMNYALKSVPGVADVGDPHGCEDGPRTPARGSRSKKCPHHVDQNEKLKGKGGQYFPQRINWPWNKGPDHSS